MKRHGVDDDSSDFEEDAGASERVPSCHPLIAPALGHLDRHGVFFASNSSWESGVFPNAN